MSYKKAIENFCKHCIVDPEAKGVGTWLQQIRDCTSSTCPLFNYRPGASKVAVKKKRVLSDEHKRKLLESRKKKQ